MATIISISILLIIIAGFIVYAVNLAKENGKLKVKIQRLKDDYATVKQINISLEETNEILRRCTISNDAMHNELQKGNA